MILSRRTLCFFTAALLLLCGCSPSLRGDPKVTVPPAATAAYTETPASDIRMTNANGDAVSLFDHLGSPVLLQFWPDPSAPTEAELDAMQRAYAEHKEDVVFLLVCPAPPTPSDAFSERGLLPLLCFDPDGSAAAVYSAKEAPVTVFVDIDGFIAARANGPLTEDALFFGLNLL